MISPSTVDLVFETARVEEVIGDFVQLKRAGSNLKGLSPFSNELMFELKFLKTYLNNYLKENLNLNQRRDYWIYDGIQMFIMMQYADEYFPELKMTGNVANLKILKSYHLMKIIFLKI